MRVLLTGGFTLGPVTPLLAVSDELRRRDPTIDIFWVGTKYGPEKMLVSEYHIPFTAIYSGKFRRYVSLRNILDNILFVVGLVQSFYHLARIRPNVIVSAGGFVSVPVVWAGWALGIPALIHQQDARPGLANRIMAPFAKRITVSFKKSLGDFKSKNITWIGNPVREEILYPNRRDSLEYFDLKKDRPVLLVLGGGTGAKKINQIVSDGLPELLKVCQIIHVTGMGKKENLKSFSDYHVFQLLTEGLPYAYAAADLVVSRAGMGTLTELSALIKPTILIPIPDSHQVNNAEMFEAVNAVQVLNQKSLTMPRFIEKIKDSFDKLEILKERAKRMHEVLPRGARVRMAELIIATSKK